jgi:hypothetical protein
MDYTAKQLSDKFFILPKEIQNTISSAEVAKTIQAIAQKHGLHVDKTGELGDETGRVMLGVTHPKNFVANLTRRLGLSSEKATEIALDVNRQIFRPIRESLKKIHGIGERLQEAGADKKRESAATTGQTNEPNVVTEKKDKEKRPATEDIHETKLKTEVRSKREEIEIKGAPSKENQYAQPPAPNGQYPPGLDPYREHID